MKHRPIELVDSARPGVADPETILPAPALDLWAFLNIHALLMTAATIVAVVSTNPFPVVAIAAAMFGRLAWLRFSTARYGDESFGYGNTVTFSRALVLIGTAAAFGRLTSQVVFSLLMVNVLLDALDGLVARRFGETSEFGATCDAEVDALYVMVAGLYFSMSAGYGVWVLIPGLLRYVHRLVAWLVAGPDFVERPRWYARNMAGVVFVLLSSAILLPSPWQLPALILATLTSSLSFSFSFLELARHGGERPPA